MNAAVEQVLEEINGAWRFRWLALGAAWAVAIIGWAVVFALPDIYQANARVFVDTRSALKPALQGLVVEQDVNAQLNYVRQSLLGGPELAKIARESGLLDSARGDARKETAILDGFRERVAITVKSGSEGDANRDAQGSIYGVEYQDSKRERALAIVRALMKALIENTLGGKREGSQNAQKFLEAQLKEIEGRLRAAEDRLADFKKQNVNAMPSEQGGYFARLQTEMDAAKTAQSNLDVALSRRSELEKQLHGETAISASSTMIAPVSGAAAGGGDVQSRIRETQAKLDELLLRFTDKHPDVIATRQTLAELKQRRAAEIESLKRGDASAVAASGAGANPVYQSIQLAVNQADVEIASLRRQVGDHLASVKQLRSALDTMPQVEAQYAQLNRDYDVNKTQYTALLTQLEKARLGQEADTSGTMRFDMIEPPNAEFAPVFPKRTLFVAGVLAAALAAGAALAYALNRLRPVFWSVNTLAAISGVTVLGAVSTAFPGKMKGDTRSRVMAYSAAAGALLAACGMALLLGRAGFRLALPGHGA